MGRLPGPLRGSHPTALDPGQPRLQLLLAPTRPTTHPAPDTAPLSGTRARTPVLGATAATDPLLPDPASGPGPTRTDRCPQTEHPRNHPAIHHSRRRDRPEPLPAPIGATEPEPITTDHRQLPRDEYCQRPMMDDAAGDQLHEGCEEAGHLLLDHLGSKNPVLGV